MAPEDIVNQALVEIGYPRRIGSFYDGRPSSIAALEVYTTTVDELLRERQWQFARGDVALVVLKKVTFPLPTPGPPSAVWDGTTPPPPWLFEYAYPTDCIEIRYLRPTPGFFTGGDSMMSAPIRFTVANDTINGVSVRVILSNLTQSVAVYTREVLDPGAWESTFVKLVVRALMRKLPKALGSMQDNKEALAEELAIVGGEDPVKS